MSIILTLVFGVLCCYTFLLLDKIEKELSRERTNETKLTYPDMGAQIYSNAILTVGKHSFNIVGGLIYGGILFTSVGHMML
jgi:hypothetical protein